MRIKQFVFSFSLLIVAFSNASFREVEIKLRSVQTAGQAAEIVRLENYSDSELMRLVDMAVRKPTDDGLLKKLRQAVSDRAMFEGSLATHNPDTVKILSNPKYEKPTADTHTSWLGSAAEKMKKLIPNFNPDLGSEAPNLGIFAGAWLTYLMWGILGVAVVAFLVFALQRWTYIQRLKRTSTAVLDEDEPERTLDEWLEMADKLEAEGRFREAVRCLYVACLLRFDEAGVARFIRSQTNWEHLARIANSEKNPGIDFRSLTQQFDLAWYGYRAKSAEDVTRFRSGYIEIVALLGVGNK